MAVIPHVADDQLIETGWGNAVADAVNAVAPLGRIAYAVSTAAFNTVANHMTYQDEGLTVTLTEVAGRFYRIATRVMVYVPGGANGVRMQLLRAGVAIDGWSLPIEALSTNAAMLVTRDSIVRNTVGGAGIVYKLQIAASNSNLQVSSYADPGAPRSLLVEDIGVAL